MLSMVVVTDDFSLNNTAGVQIVRLFTSKIATMTDDHDGGDT